MTMEKTKNEFLIYDKFDEKQIQEADKEIRQALVYENKKGGKQITFIGLKWLTLKMSQTGQPLEIVKSEVKLDKDIEDDQKFWYWRAYVICRNTKTGLETDGISECQYLEATKDSTAYDPFGRTKAHSKAQRNAWRKQIPELEIQALLKSAKGEDVHSEDSAIVCTCMPDKRSTDGFGTHCKTCNKPFSDTVKDFYKGKK